MRTAKRKREDEALVRRTTEIATESMRERLREERALSDALVVAIHEGCHVDVLGEEMVDAAFAEHRRLRGVTEDD